MAAKKEHERLLRISRRNDTPLWQNILIRIGFILFAFLICGLISMMADPTHNFGAFYYYIFRGNFSSTKVFVTLLWQTALLFVIALAITPAFKMKFWNIGAEGQCLMGALGALIAMKFIAPSVPNFLAIVIELAMAVGFGLAWAVIPAIFKAHFNTNETLFTLMMNYVAMGLVAASVMAWSTSGSNVLGIVNRAKHEGWLPYVGTLNNSFLLNIIFVVLVGVLIWVYLRFSKHGYELSVVGGSRDTAKYVGINVKAVIIRTMILSGAICGIAGFLMVAGASHTISETLVGGRGFTAILVSWLGSFSVPLMAIYAFLVSFISVGGSYAASQLQYSATVSNVLTGVFFIFVIMSNFFINFRVHINLFKKKDGTSSLEEVTFDKPSEEIKEGN